jgi:putative transposase
VVISPYTKHRNNAINVGGDAHIGPLTSKKCKITHGCDPPITPLIGVILMNFPKRKPNRLRGYDYSKTGAYFITICVKNMQKLLGDVVGGDSHTASYVRLSKYGRVVDKYVRNLEGIDKYVIMPNHIHMTIMIDTPNNGLMWSSAPTTNTEITQNRRGRCPHRTADPKEIQTDVGANAHIGPMAPCSRRSVPSASTSIPQLIRSLKTLISKEIGFSIFQRSYYDRIIRNEQEYQQIWQYIDTNPAKWEDDKYYS